MNSLSLSDMPDGIGASSSSSSIIAGMHSSAVVAVVVAVVGSIVNQTGMSLDVSVSKT